MSGYIDTITRPVMATDDVPGVGQGPGMPRFLGAAMAFYHYLAGKEGKSAGIGTGADALIQPQSLPINTRYAYGPLGNMVRGDLGPNRPGFAKQGQDLLPVDLLANGAYYHGTTNFASLSAGGNITPKAPGNG